MTHIHTQSGQFDYTVAGYLVHGEKTLLIKHKSLPIWTSPAGHIELDESPVDALFKEIYEESGIDRAHLTLVQTHAATGQSLRSENATHIPIPFDMEFHNITEDHRHINLAYILASDTDDVRPGDGESQTFRWFSIEDLRNFTETNQSIIQSAIYAITYIQENKQ